jgi:hypothetical protein
MWVDAVRNKFIFTMGTRGEDLTLVGGQLGLSVDGKAYAVVTAAGQKAGEALDALLGQIRAAGYEVDVQRLQSSQPGGGRVEVQEWIFKERSTDQPPPPGGGDPPPPPPGGGDPPPPPPGGGDPPPPPPIKTE